MSINTNPQLVGVYPYRLVSSDTDGALSISVREKKWWWYLDLNGEPLHRIGNACGTCAAVYARVRDLQVPLGPQELSSRLEQGLHSLPEDVLQTVMPLLPRGDYLVGLVETSPTRVSAKERPSDVGCEADYFWWQLYERYDKGCRYELVIPSLPESSLKADRIDEYCEKLQQGERPTALALSMSDQRCIRGEYYETARVHILLDGHHKVMAASRLGLPITILSFMRENWLTGKHWADPKEREYYAQMTEKLTSA